jgi:hypothetical protein
MRNRATRTRSAQPTFDVTQYNPQGVIAMTDEEIRKEAPDEPVIKVDKRKTRREKREEEAAPAETPEDTQAASVEPEANFEPEPEPAAPWPDEEASAEEPAAETQPPVDPFAAVNVYDNLRFLISLFASQAWVHLGIQAPPGAGETRTDLAQARLAIDMIAAIKEKLGDDLTTPEKNEVELLLSNLRVNYLQRQTAG